MARFVFLLIILFIAFMLAITIITGTLRRVFGGGLKQQSKKKMQKKSSQPTTQVPTTNDILFSDPAVTVLRGEAIPKPSTNDAHS